MGTPSERETMALTTDALKTCGAAMAWAKRWICVSSSFSSTIVVAFSSLAHPGVTSGLVVATNKTGKCGNAATKLPNSSDVEGSIQCRSSTTMMPVSHASACSRCSRILKSRARSSCDPMPSSDTPTSTLRRMKSAITARSCAGTTPARFMRC